MRALPLIGAIIGSAAVAAPAQAVTPASHEKAVAWSAVSKPTRASRAVRIEFSYTTCGVPDNAVSRIVVERRRRSIVLTVLMHRPDASDARPCAQVARVYRRIVGLRGPLGSRYVRDGATGRVRVKRPG